MMAEVRPLRLLGKSIVAFVVTNLIFAALNPAIGRLSIYNHLVPGRWRFPIQQGNPLSSSGAPQDLDALFGSHEISGTFKTRTEYRVLLLGDSQTWGATLPFHQTLGARLNAARLSACGMDLRFYNLAYPYGSVLKDFFTLDKSLPYRPDLVVWMLTPKSFRPTAETLVFVKDDPGSALDLLGAYNLDRYDTLVGPRVRFLKRTFISQAARLHRWALLQVYGLIWAATGFDHQWTFEDFRRILEAASPPALHLSTKLDWDGMQPPRLRERALALDVLPATRKLIGDLPLLAVVEPMFIPPGNGVSPRYNRIYPRWAFDAFVQLLQSALARQGWGYLDLHALVAYTDFVDDNFHLTADGEAQLAQALEPVIQKVACP
jgi:lysophospholipase L1-like esterase